MDINTGVLQPVEGQKMVQLGFNRHFRKYDADYFKLLRELMIALYAHPFSSLSAADRAQNGIAHSSDWLV